MDILEKARPENCFRCADGAVLGSVYELENKLCTMGRETFYHHANQFRNDFHNWIKDVFRDYELANELLKAKTPAEAAATIRKHLRKALLAKDGIEGAIQTVRKPAKAATKAAKGKNRKLNKNNRNNRKKTRRRKNRSSRNNKSGYGQKRGRILHKRIKKQVNKWLNWLRIVPEP